MYRFNFDIFKFSLAFAAACKHRCPAHHLCDEDLDGQMIPSILMCSRAVHLTKPTVIYKQQIV